MAPFSANPYVYILPAIVVVALIAYFAYVAADRYGIPEHRATALITGKQHNLSGTTYNTNIAGGRAWTQAIETPETYVLLLRVEGNNTVAAVSQPTFERLKEGDEVEVMLKRTRITERLLVTDVAKLP